MGVFWGGTTINEVEQVPKTWQGVFNLFKQTGPNGKKWKPVVYDQKKYHGLESVVQALKDLGARKTFGKAVIELGGATHGQSKI